MREWENARLRTKMRIKAWNGKKTSLPISISYGYVAQRFTKICSAANNLFVLFCLSATMMDFKWNQTGWISKFCPTLWRFLSFFSVVVVVVIVFIPIQFNLFRVVENGIRWELSQTKSGFFTLNSSHFSENWRRRKKLISTSFPIRPHILIIIYYSFPSNTNLTQIKQLKIGICA